MRAHESLAEFERYAADRGVRVAELTCAQALELLTGFYRDVRVEDCDPEAAGDALLVEWGTHDWGAGDRFEFCVARQFFLSGGAEAPGGGVVEDADERIWHLNLTLRFPPTPTLRALGADGRWCQSADDLERVLAEVRAGAAWAAIRDRADADIELGYESGG